MRRRSFQLSRLDRGSTQLGPPRGRDRPLRAPPRARRGTAIGLEADRRYGRRGQQPGGGGRPGAVLRRNPPVLNVGTNCRHVGRGLYRVCVVLVAIFLLAPMPSGAVMRREIRPGSEHSWSRERSWTMAVSRLGESKAPGRDCSRHHPRRSETPRGRFLPAGSRARPDGWEGLSDRSRKGNAPNLPSAALGGFMPRLSVVSCRARRAA